MSCCEPLGVSGACGVYHPGGHPAGEAVSAQAWHPRWQASGRVPWLGCSLSSGSAGGLQSLLADRGCPPAQQRKAVWLLVEKAEALLWDRAADGVVHTCVHSKANIQLLAGGVEWVVHALGLNWNPLYSSSHCSHPPLSCICSTLMLRTVVCWMLWTDQRTVKQNSSVLK